MAKIEPRTLRGFRDYLPEIMIPRERLIDTAKRVYRSFGFSPIDTPALEYLEILLGKGSDETDKQMYRFKDNGGRDVGMRFDLTIPLARFVAQHQNELPLPFKRYHIATVWRGESSQKGRYREFVQCDFDTIGTVSDAADIEMVLVIHELFRALGVEKFAIRVNNRKVLNGLLEKLNLVEQSTNVLRAIDKLAKIGAEKVTEELAATANCGPEQAAQVLALCSMKGDNASILNQLDQLVAGNATGETGAAQLRAVIDGTTAAGVAPERIKLDVSIARGLDYYTGTIVETFLDDLPTIGSVCSGGRYDNLAELYTNQKLPGIGASLGLDRLLSALEELGVLPKISTPAPIFIPYFDAKRLGDYLKLSQRLRAAGFGVEVYPDPKKLGAQLKYADRRGFAVALVAGDQEFAANSVQIKNLKESGSATVSLEGTVLEEELRKILG